MRYTLTYTLEVTRVQRKKWNYIGELYRGNSNKKIAAIYASSETGLYLRVLWWRISKARKELN